jgi:hypothetical protein
MSEDPRTIQARYVTLRNLLTEQTFWLYLNANDTFDYATADAERFVICDENLDALIAVYERWGRDGVVAMMAHLRNRPPLAKLATPGYQEAREYLSLWEYEDD